MAIAEHLIAHTRDGARSLLEHVEAPWLWAHLRAGFPDAFSCELMRDHVHLVAPPVGSDGSSASSRCSRRGSACASTCYGFHNPVADGFVGDPYAWRWSTLRDLVGAAFPIWTDASRVAAALATREERLLRRVTHNADLRPRRPELVPLTTASMGVLQEAIAAALRIDEDSVRRHLLGRQLVAQTAYAIGTPAATQLAIELGCSGRTVRRDHARRHPALPAVLLCLADARLRHPAMPRR